MGSYFFQAPWLIGYFLNRGIFAKLSFACLLVALIYEVFLFNPTIAVDRFLSMVRILLGILSAGFLLVFGFSFVLVLFHSTIPEFPAKLDDKMRTAAERILFGFSALIEEDH